jgi:hypothetical protein
MGRPLKDRRGLDERWRMTTVRVPRWLADQLRDLARARGHDETWTTLVDVPGVRLPDELPPRYANLGRPKGD